MDGAGLGVRVDARSLIFDEWDAAITYYTNHKGKHYVNNYLLEKFGINKEAVRRRIKSGSTSPVKWRRPSTFTFEEEKVIHDSVLRLQTAQYFITRGQLLACLAGVVAKMGKSTPTRCWLRSFLDRHRARRC